MALPSSQSYDGLQSQAAQMPVVFSGPISPASESSLPILPSSGTRDLLEELRQAKREIELLKSQDPFRAADMALEIQVEKLRAAEATSARDSAVQRLASAYDSIKQKAIAVGKLNGEKADLERKLADSEVRLHEAVAAARVDERKRMEAENNRLTNTISALTAEFNTLKHGKDGCGSGSLSPEPFKFVSSLTTISPETDPAVETVSNTLANLAIGSSSLSDFSGHSTMQSRVQTPLKMTDFNPLPLKTYDRDYRVFSPIGDPVEMARIRSSILTSLPVPTDVPDDCLQPIIIPSPITLHEFLGNATGSLKNTLASYRVFQDSTTWWCPEREEHGYFLTPLYKCNTNPRIVTAHRWSEVDPKGNMNTPTECFYNKEGKWYYAGQYVALRLEDLTAKEWENLASETTSAIVKETLAGRKNTSPQNHYETSQLYAIGALKVACIGVQCVSFNMTLYRAVMEQVEKCQQTGKWRQPWDEAMLVPELARHHSEPYLTPHAAPGLGF